MHEAEKMAREHTGAVIENGEVCFCGIKDGQPIELRLKTIEVGYEEYDTREGWVDHTAILPYKTAELKSAV